MYVFTQTPARVRACVLYRPFSRPLSLTPMQRKNMNAYSRADR